MAAQAVQRSSVVDRLDRQILHCLIRDGRASFARIAAALEVSEQTVARRYRRLVGDGVVRVVALPHRLDPATRLWSMRLACRPGSAAALADALARRSDTAWVTITAGGAEVFCSLIAAGDAEQDDLLLQRLPRTVEVLRFAAHRTLHRFLDRGVDDWHSFGDPLAADQLERLGPPQYRYQAQRLPEVEPLHAEDGPLVAALGRDARPSWAQLAATTGWSEARVRRRTEALLNGGGLFIDIDLSSWALGFRTSAMMWLRVAPAHLAAAGEALRAHDEVTFAAAITGSTNLVASVQVRTDSELYQYVTTQVAALPGVTGMEISPTMRVVKQAGTLTDGHFLAVTAPPARPTVRRRPAGSRG